jgi:hypothetical protein
MERQPPDALPVSQQTILACVNDQSGQFNRSALAKVLAGSASVRVAGQSDNPYFGRLAETGRKAITFEIDILIQQGYLELDWREHLIPATEQ